MRLPALLSSLVLIGCGPKVVRLYEGPPRPATEVAQLKAAVKKAALFQVTSCDGHSAGMSTEMIEATPGLHRCMVQCVTSSANTTSFEVIFNAVGGHVYELDGGVIYRGGRQICEIEIVEARPTGGR